MERRNSEGNVMRHERGCQKAQCTFCQLQYSAAGNVITTGLNHKGYMTLRGSDINHGIGIKLVLQIAACGCYDVSVVLWNAESATSYELQLEKHRLVAARAGTDLGHLRIAWPAPRAGTETSLLFEIAQ
eukprot:6201687-Pleurochrysis_carterae.AAC.3